MHKYGRSAHSSLLPGGPRVAYPCTKCYVFVLLTFTSLYVSNSTQLTAYLNDLDSVPGGGVICSEFNQNSSQVDANVLKKISRGQPTWGGPSAWGLEGRLKAADHKTIRMLRNVTRGFGMGYTCLHDN
jgi:hypothetical protein